MRPLFSSSFRSHAGLLIFSFVFLGFTVAGCGHSSTPTTPTTLTLSPSGSISMDFTRVTSVTATVTDSNGNTVSNPTITWASSNTNVASVTATGGACGDSLNLTTTTCLCAGSWSSDFLSCKAPPSTSGGQPQPGTANITASYQGLTTTLTVLVHAPVARVDVAPSSVDCLSSAGTQQLTATAFDSLGNDITSTVASDQSSFNWSSSDATVASISTKGLVTAVNPGQTRLYASIAGTSSPPASFTTCPVQKITLAVSGGSGSTFSVAQGSTQQLTPTVVDSNGNTITITSGRLLYGLSYSVAVSLNSNGLASGVNPGSSTIVASCSPPSCNNGLYPVFGNAILGTTSGSTSTGTNSKSTQVIVASKTDTQLIPYDITTGTVGTALTLPYKPNSMVYSHASAVAYMGSDTELMTYSPATSTITAAAVIPGTIISLSNNGGIIVLYDDVSKIVTVYNLSTAATVGKFSVPGATLGTVHASTSPDGATTYVVVGNQLLVANTTKSQQTVTLASAANDVAFLLQGSFAYLAGGQANAVTALTTCDNSQKDVVSIGASPERIVPSADGYKVYALSGGVINTVTATTDGAGCPPALTDALVTHDLGQGAFTATQILSTTNGSKVYFVTDAGKIVVFDTTANTGSVVSLSGTSATTGGLTMDGANLWVGGGADKKLHRIDTSSNTDAQQVTVPVSADLVAVRNQ